MSRQVTLTAHTTSGIEFEITDSLTGEILWQRDYWCEEGDEESESAGWEYFKKGIAQRGWTLTQEAWS